MRWAFFLFLTQAHLVFADQTCWLNGAQVNLYNGAETQGKTGVVSCKNEKGEVVRQQEFQNGKKSGLVMITSFGGGQEKYHEDEKGRRYGKATKTSAQGVLLTEENYSNGQRLGLQKTFHDNGKPKSIAWHEKDRSSPVMQIVYDKEGALSSIVCATKSYTDIDKGLCGFSGPKSSELKKGFGKIEKVTYKNGVLQDASVQAQGGKLKEQSKFEGGREHRKTFFSSGQLESDSVYEGTLIKSSVTYYMNGQKKSEVIYSDSENSSTREVTEYFDNGKISRQGQERLINRLYVSTGAQKSYYDSGKPHAELNFDAKGKMQGEQKSYNKEGQLIRIDTYSDNIKTRGKEFDEKGALIKDKEYYPDGSSKDLLPSNK